MISKTYTHDPALNALFAELRLRIVTSQRLLDSEEAFENYKRALVDELEIERQIVDHIESREQHDGP